MDRSKRDTQIHVNKYLYNWINDFCHDWYVCDLQQEDEYTIAIES